MPQQPRQFPHWADPFYQARYGMGVNDKLQFEGAGRFPGAVPGEDSLNRQRAASAYLFAKKWPRAARVIQPAVDAAEGFIGRPNAPVWTAPFSAFGATPEQIAASGRGHAGAYAPQPTDQSSVTTSTSNFRLAEPQAPPPMPSIRPLQPPSLPAPPSPFLPAGPEGMGRDVGYSFGGMDLSRPGGELPSVNVNPYDMGVAEQNQARVNAGLPPLNPTTGQPLYGGAPQGSYHRPALDLNPNPTGVNTGYMAANQVFGGLDPRAQYVSMPSRTTGLTPEEIQARIPSPGMQPAQAPAPVTPMGVSGFLPGMRPPVPGTPLPSSLPQAPQWRGHKPSSPVATPLPPAVSKPVQWKPTQTPSSMTFPSLGGGGSDSGWGGSASPMQTFSFGSAPRKGF